jgi:nicotinamidase-related amidase
MLMRVCLVKGEDGSSIVPELKPEDDEVVIDKPGKGAFYATSLDLVLRTSGIRNIILCGVSVSLSLWVPACVRHS